MSKKSNTSKLKASDPFTEVIEAHLKNKASEDLMLAAKLKGRVVENVEVSLPDLRITQARGLQNEPTSHNEKIIKLVKENLHQIRMRQRQQQQSA